MNDAAQWVSSIANVVLAGAAVVAAFQGTKSLTAWRRELIGSKKAALAEDVLSDFYRARDLINSIRSPFSFQGEGSAERQRGEFETDDQAQRLDTYYVPIARIGQHSEFFGDLLAKRHRMKALFGDEADPAFDTINQTLRHIQHAAGMLSQLSKRPAGTGRQVQWDRYEAVIWSGLANEEDGEGDSIANAVDDAVATIERVCGPVLEDRG